MWEPPTIGNPMGVYVLTILSSAVVIIGAIYGFCRWVRGFFIKRFLEIDKQFQKVEERFVKMDIRFEMIENRIFQLAMGKSLKDIMIEERENISLEKDSKEENK